MAGYNGWANWETWNVMLWMDNEEPAYLLYVGRVRRHKGRFTGVDARACCEEAFGDGTPDGVKLSDSRIHWGEVAAAMREVK